MDLIRDKKNGKIKFDWRTLDQMTIREILKRYFYRLLLLSIPAFILLLLGLSHLILNN